MIVQGENTSAVRLLFVRHGETVSNVERRYMGQTDSPLTLRGIVQAKAVAKRLGKNQIDAIYSSDLGCAVQTADVIARECALQVMRDSRLRERHVGLLQGELSSVAHEKYASVFLELEHNGPGYAFPGGGENGIQVEERITSFLDMISIEYLGKTVVAVSHGAALCVLLRHILKFSYNAISRLRCDNACISSLIFFDGGWNIEFWNDTVHL